MHQLCQLCFFITSFENMSTLPNFAQLCILVTAPYKQKLALNSGIQTYQILANDDEVCIPSLSNILLAVTCLWCNTNIIKNLVKSLEHWISIPTSKRLRPHCYSRAIVSYCIPKRSSVRPSFLTRIFFGIPHFTLVDLISLETWNLDLYFFVTNSLIVWRF